jgi:hypothetical protein
MALIKRVNPGRGGFQPGIIRVPVKTTLHPITHRALCVACVEQNRALGLLLDDILSAHFEIAIEARLPDRPEDGPGDNPGPTPAEGSDRRSDDRKPEGPACGPEAS